MSTSDKEGLVRPSSHSSFQINSNLMCNDHILIATICKGLSCGSSLSLIFIESSVQLGHLVLVDTGNKEHI